MKEKWKELISLLPKSDDEWVSANIPAFYHAVYDRDAQCPAKIIRFVIIKVTGNYIKLLRVPSKFSVTAARKLEPVTNSPTDGEIVEINVKELFDDNWFEDEEVANIALKRTTLRQISYLKRDLKYKKQSMKKTEKLIAACKKNLSHR